MQLQVIFTIHGSNTPQSSRRPDQIEILECIKFLAQQNLRPEVDLEINLFLWN